MRAAHSLKGAARIVAVDAGVAIAHVMESCFVAAQSGGIVLRQPQIDALLRAVDLLRRIAQTPESRLGEWSAVGLVEVTACVTALNRVLEGADIPVPGSQARLKASRRALPPHRMRLPARPVRTHRAASCE